MSAVAPERDPERDAVSDPEASETQRYTRILLASEGREISDAAIRRVLKLAHPSGASVHVFTIARIHGVAFGMQTPGLLPNKREWAEQRDIVTKTIKRLKHAGLDAEGHVLGTRKATQGIVNEAKKKGCEAIVMAADPDRHILIRDMMWTQEPQRVRRKAKVPVFLVVEDE